MRTLFIGTLLLLATSTFAQVNVRDSTVQGWLFHATANYHLKGGDFAEYLNPSYGIGGDLQYKWKSNFILSVGGRYNFGDGVKDPLTTFGDIFTAQGEILTSGGEYAYISFSERGWNATLDVGYIVNSLGHNANSGLLITAGAGWNAHWIQVRNQSENTPQLQDEYLKGYDRFTQGVLTRQFLGYQFSGNNEMINFTAGFEFMQGFNHNVREFNYATRSYDTGAKLDLYYGLRVSWFLPIYNQNAQKYYYY